jgi:membrane protease YdiL (CAAX protease family)
MRLKNYWNTFAPFVVALFWYFFIGVNWAVFISLNRRISPSIVWFPLGGVLALLIMWFSLRPRWIPVQLLPSRVLDVRPKIVTALGIVCCICIAAASAVLSQIPFVPMNQSNLKDTSLALPYAISAPIFAAISEELVFRGIVQPTIHAHRSFLSAAFFTSLLFVASHFDPTTIIFRAPFLFVFSFFLCYLSWRTNSLIYPLAAHTIYNLLVTIPLLFKESIGYSNVSSETFYSIVLTGIVAFAMIVLIERKILQQGNDGIRLNGVG